MTAISIQRLARMAREEWRNWVGWALWLGALGALSWMGNHYWHIHSTPLFCGLLIVICLLLIIAFALIEKREQR